MKTQPHALLDTFVLAFIKGFYVYAISRRLAGLLINFKESDWSCHKSLILYKRAEVLKTRVQNFIALNSKQFIARALKEPGHSLKNLMQFGPTQINCILSPSRQI